MGLEDVIEFEKGKKILKTHLVELPDPSKVTQKIKKNAK